MEIDAYRWYTIEEISKLAYLARGTVGHDIRRGRLAATWVPTRNVGRYMVKGSDLQAWLNKPRPSAGRPWGKHDN